MKNRSFSFFNIGTTSLVLIFLVLCLVTFSVLSFVTARADYNMSRKTAVRTQEYYLVSSQAEEILAVLDRTLSDLYHQTDSEEMYQEAIRNTDWDLIASDTTCSDDASGIFLEYELPMTENQALHVALTPLYPVSSADGFYRIDAWNLVDISYWEADDSLPVYQAPQE